MPRPKKDAKTLSIRLAASVADRLEQFCKDSGQTKTLAVERALTAYIDDYYDRQAMLDRLDTTQKK